MCLKLEEQVTTINQEKYDCSGTRERRYSGLPLCAIPGPSFSWSVMECAYSGGIFMLTSTPLKEYGRYDKASNGQCEQARSCLGNRDVEKLLKTAKSAKEEAHTHHKEKIYQGCQLDLGEVDQENVFSASPPISSNLGGHHGARVIRSPALVGQNRDHSLPSIEPIKEVFTIKISSCTKAMMETMSSTAFLTRSQRAVQLNNAKCRTRSWHSADRRVSLPPSWQFLL